MLRVIHWGSHRDSLKPWQEPRNTKYRVFEEFVGRRTEAKKRKAEKHKGKLIPMWFTAFRELYRVERHPHLPKLS
jgi:hypothetical protein